MTIQSTIPTIMAAGLANHNLSYFKKKKKGLLPLGIANIVGTELIRETSHYTNW